MPETSSPIRLTTIVTGNVFDMGGAAVGIDTEVEAIRWIVRDGYDTVVARGEHLAETLDGALRLPLPGPGWYTLEVSGETRDGKVHRAETDLAVLAALDDAFVRDRRLGISAHYGQRWPIESSHLIVRAGFGIVRDEAYWQEQESAETPGAFVWQPNVERYERAFTEAGIGILRVLSYGHDGYGASAGRHGDYTPVTQPQRDAFARYAVETVRRLGTQGHVFEVWNEWNYRERDGGAGANDYVALLATVRAAVDATFGPGVVKLVGPALAPYNATWESWFASFVDGGGLDLVDFVSTHPYADPEVPETAPVRFAKHWQRIRAIVRERTGTDGPPLMLTETGWGTQEGPEGVSESDQAILQVRGVLIALADGVENVTIYDFMDDGLDSSDREHRLGMIRNMGDPRGAFVPKPAFVGSAVMNRALAGLTPDPSGSLHDDQTWIARFSDGTRTVYAAWALEPSTVMVHARGPVTVTRMFGDTVTLAPSEMSFIVSLDPRPVYLSGPIESIQRR